MLIPAERVNAEMLFDDRRTVVALPPMPARTHTHTCLSLSQPLSFCAGARVVVQAKTYFERHVWFDPGIDLMNSEWPQSVYDVFA